MSYLQRCIPSIGLFADFAVTGIASIGTKGRQSGNQHSEVIVYLKRKQGIHVQYEEFDEKWLKEKATDGKWRLRKTLIDDYYTDLVREFKHGKGRKKEKKTVEAACHKITDFFKDTEKNQGPLDDRQSPKKQVSISV